MAVITIWQNEKRVELSFEGTQPLSDLLIRAGFAAHHPCGGRGTCGKCEVTVSGNVSEPNEAEQKAGTRLSCQVLVLGDAEVILPEQKTITQIQNDIVAVQKGSPMEGTLGAAVDIGTTTLALQVYDLKTGALVGTAAAPNPQISVSADVMGRIGAAMEGKLDLLQGQIINAIDKLLLAACGSRVKEVDLLVLTGNTTMLYLLTGRDPSCLAHAPFRADTLFDVQTRLLGRTAYLPGCMDAFVGADITCAVLLSGMCEKGAVALLCDVGTNGEIALWKDGVLYVSSTAAGPAFEGAGISCGCGSIPGAIDKVWIENGALAVHTIGEAPAVGLCGSGLIDAVAAMLELEWMDETGAMDEDEVELAENVKLLQRDIRAVQLAKAAIAAGIKTLMEAAGVTCRDIETFYLAGGFGSHLNRKSAAAIGLFPAELAEKTVVLGNAALSGAAELMLNKDRLIQCRQITAAAKQFNLGGNPHFNENYIDAMMFENS